MGTEYLGTKEEKLARNQEFKNGYVARLVAALGSGADWDYRGECGEDPHCGGKCSCGHEGLRFLFTLHHRVSGKTAIVGSTCVNQYPGVNPEVLAAMERDLESMKAKAREAVKAAKAASAASEVQAMVASLSEKYWECDRAVAKWMEYNRGGEYWMPEPIYRRRGAIHRLTNMAGGVHPFIATSKFRKLKSVSGQKKVIASALAKVDEAIKEIRAL